MTSFDKLYIFQHSHQDSWCISISEGEQQNYILPVTHLRKKRTEGMEMITITRSWFNAAKDSDTLVLRIA